MTRGARGIDGIGPAGALYRRAGARAVTPAVRARGGVAIPARLMIVRDAHARERQRSRKSADVSRRIGRRRNDVTFGAVDRTTIVATREVKLVCAYADRSGRIVPLGVERWCGAVSTSVTSRALCSVELNNAVDVQVAVDDFVVGANDITVASVASGRLWVRGRRREPMARRAFCIDGIGPAGALYRRAGAWAVAPAVGARGGVAIPARLMIVRVTYARECQIGG